MHVNVFPCKLEASKNLGHTPAAGTPTNWLLLQIITRPIWSDYSERKMAKRSRMCAEEQNQSYFSKNNAVLFLPSLRSLQ